MLSDPSLNETPFSLIIFNRPNWSSLVKSVAAISLLCSPTLAVSSATSLSIAVFLASNFFLNKLYNDFYMFYKEFFELLLCKNLILVF